jgi:hypothetical protein
MKRVLPPSICAASVIAFAGLPLSPQVTAAQEPTITVSSVVPVEVSDPTNLSTAAAFAWGEFIALTWPALPQGQNNAFPRGMPDTDPSLKYGDKGKTGQVVWETFRHKTEAFPGQGNPNGFDTSKPDLGFASQPAYVYKTAPANGIPASGLIPPLNPNWNPPLPPFHNLDEVTQIGLDGMYAGAVAPSSNPSQSTNVKEKILFEAKLNEVVYQYAAQPRTDPSGNQYSYFQSDNTIVMGITSNIVNYFLNGSGPPPNPFISLPPSNPTAGKVGSIEVKASFRRLGPRDDPTKYYTAVVRYYRGYQKQVGNQTETVITGYVDSNDPTVNEVWGLTSLHIIQKTPNAPTFVFATFGHINNILDAAGNNVEEPDGTTKQEYMNIPPFLPALTITPSVNNKPQSISVTGNGMPPANTSSYQLYFNNLTGGLVNSPINVSRRLYPIPPPITAANRAAYTAIQAVNPQAVWLNYRLINVQARPLDLSNIPANEEPTFFTSNEVVETNPALQHFTGRIQGGEPTNFQGGKPVKNTYVVQPNGTIIAGYNMGGCMGCHGQVGQKQAGDFSVLLANGRVASPDPIDIDESSPAVRRALVEKYLGKSLSKNR